MAVKIFLDANVLLDLALQREKFADAKIILEAVYAFEVQGYITSSVFHIAGYWLTKAQGDTKAREFLLLLLDDLRIIDIPHDMAIIALSSKFSDIEDSLQYYAALHHKMDYFISADKKLKKYATQALPVLTANEFIKVFI